MNLVQDRKAIAAMTAAVVLSGALVATLVLRTSSAAFTASDTNSGNSFATGVVSLTDSSPGVALFDTANLTQGLLDGAQSVTRCLTVTLHNTTTEAAPRDIRMYVTNVATDQTLTPLAPLAPYLNLSVSSAPLPSSSGAVPVDCVTTDPTHTQPYSALANSVLLTPANSPAAQVGGGAFTLATAGTSTGTYPNGLTGWATAAPSESRVYKITATVQDTNSAQGLNATADFVWEAR